MSRAIPRSAKRQFLEAKPSSRNSPGVERRHVRTRRHRRQVVGAVCGRPLPGWWCDHHLRSVNSRSGVRTRCRPGEGASSTTSTIVAATHHVAPASTDLFTMPAVASFVAGTTDDRTAGRSMTTSPGKTSVYRPACRGRNGQHHEGRYSGHSPRPSSGQRGIAHCSGAGVEREHD